MNYNHHGLVFSINTLSANTLHSGKTRKYHTNRLPSDSLFEEVIENAYVLCTTTFSQPLAIFIKLIGLFIFLARHFITRALLSAPNFEQAQKILRDNGVGAADGCSINMTFLK